MRSFARRHPIVVDAALAAAVLCVNLALGHQQPPAGMRAPDPLGYALTVAACTTLVFRRYFPLPVLVAYCLIWTGYIAAGFWPVVNSAGALLAVYTVAAHRPLREAVAAVLLLDAVWIYGGLRGGENEYLTLLSQALVWPVVICWFGTRARRLTELTARLRDEQEEKARRAVDDERIRVARELHDVVAHHMAVVSVQAGLAWYVFDSDRDTARTALGAVLETSAQAQEEMRRLLILLRKAPLSGADETTASGLARLPELVGRIRGAGLPVELTVTGEVREVPRGVDVCAYRMVQEALTNVLKHTGHGPAAVTVDYREDDLVVRVRDTGPSVPAASATGGHGLRGMRERAALYGGALEAGPHPDGGFEVVLTLPFLAAE
ncbi:ATPase [Actinoplanes ianthinogenes]|uniref:histidine kinase n=1 Tax=Actinoplanes ianthinogenes TaxID=122358 RepID=A0ABM7M9C3_9ACTN|nr:ATPase [Actinoplanes ianthinogenes]GGR07163.1 ATPase [Actinoplanes ianthinogenes]